MTDEVHLSIEPTDALFFAEQILNAFKEHQKKYIENSKTQPDLGDEKDAINPD